MGSVDPFGVTKAKMEVIEDIEDMRFESEPEFFIEERPETVRSRACSWVHLETSEKGASRELRGDSGRG